MSSSAAFHPLHCGTPHSGSLTLSLRRLGLSTIFNKLTCPHSVQGDHSTVPTLQVTQNRRRELRTFVREAINENFQTTNNIKFQEANLLSGVPAGGHKCLCAHHLPLLLTRVSILWDFDHVYMYIVHVHIAAMCQQEAANVSVAFLSCS